MKTTVKGQFQKIAKTEKAIIATVAGIQAGDVAEVEADVENQAEDMVAVEEVDMVVAEEADMAVAEEVDMEVVEEADTEVAVEAVEVVKETILIMIMMKVTNHTLKIVLMLIGNIISKRIVSLKEIEVLSLIMMKSLNMENLIKIITIKSMEDILMINMIWIMKV